MAPREFKNFINGQFVEAKSGQTSDVINPATGEVYATSAVSNSDDVAAAFEAADKAFDAWGQTTPAERQLALFRIADAMEARAEEFADIESQLDAVVSFADVFAGRSMLSIDNGNLAAIGESVGHEEGCESFPAPGGAV